MNKGWPVKRLGDLAEIITKGTTPTSVGHAFVSEGINFIKIESISENGLFLESKLARITQGCHEKLKRSQLKSGDILFSIAGALGRTAFVTEDILPANTNQALAIVRLKTSDNVSPAFILKALSTGIVLEQIEKFKGGVAQQNLSLAQVQDFKVPIPPILEQQRIVSIIDKAFDGIATAKAKVEKNLQNARVLVKSQLRSIFTERGDGWIEKKLEEICVLQRGLDLPIRSRVAGAHPIVSSGGVIDTHNEGKIKGPGVATGRSGSIGNVFYIEEDFWPLNTVLYVKQFYENDPKFVYWLLSYFDLRRFATGTGVPTLNRNFVHEERVAIPKSVSVQRAIRKRIDELRVQTERLEDIYQQKLVALDSLKQSLLHHAFTGQL